MDETLEEIKPEEQAAESAAEESVGQAEEAEPETVSAETVEEVSEESSEEASEAESAPEEAEKAEEPAPSEKKAEKKKRRSAAETAAAASARLGKCAKASYKNVKYSLLKIFPALIGFLAGIGSAGWRAVCRITAAAVYGSVTAVILLFRRIGRELELILPEAVGFLAGLGRSAWGVLRDCAAFLFRLAASFISATVGKAFHWFAKKLKQPLYDVWCFLLTPFAHTYGAFAEWGGKFKKACRKGFLPAVGAVFSGLWSLICGIFELLRFGFNYIAPAVSVVFLIALVRYSSTIQYAINLEYNGSQIATIESEAAYNEAQSLVQDKITFTENDQPILTTPRFTVTVRNMEDPQEQPVSDIDALSELMIETGDVPVVYAYGLYINGELIGVYSDEDMETIRSALDDKLEYYTEPNSVNVYFEDDISITQGRFIADVLTTPESALELINGSTEVEAYYVVKRGDSITSVCDSLGITREEFEADNPSLAGGLKTGDIVTYHYLEPHLNVLSTHYENYGQVIERTVQYEYNSRREQYCEVLRQHGSDGYENVTALVTSTNGKESDRVIVSRTVTEAMVPMIIRTGTKENTYIGDDTDILETLGTFIWPVGDEDCYISSTFGYRSWDHSNHRAVDIAGIPRGTDIYAACDGKVTFSGWYGSYGKLVIIDHGHGYETYYGHCNDLLVEEGDRVEKGDVIAKVGMTGNASGYHLHFEMRHNDTRIDPLIALGGPGGYRYNMA